MMFTYSANSVESGRNFVDSLRFRVFLLSDRVRNRPLLTVRARICQDKLLSNCLAKYFSPRIKCQKSRWWALIRIMSQDDDYNLINVSGPLTIEAILKSVQQRFNNGQYYVSNLHIKLLKCLTI